MVTDKQKKLMQHTIKGGCRNWFHADKGSKDANEFDALVKQGLATEETAPAWLGGGVIYRLTDEGKRYLAV